MNIFNKAVVSAIQILPKKFIKLFANRYIAGVTLSEAVETIKKLESKELFSTVDVLGESIKEKKEAIKSADENLAVLNAIYENKLPAYLSVKLTMIGLDIDFDFCLGLFRKIVEDAKSKNIFVRIDMEDSSVTESTIRIFEEARKEFDNVGVVIQAYLRRSEADIRRLVKIGASFRICKGIYLESESIAFKGKDEIRENYLKILKIALENGSYCGIATHDEYLVEGAERIIKELELSEDKYEFQMLLGVREHLRNEIQAKGHKVRIYIPFGKRWYEYTIRRFKENPNIAGQVMKSIIFR